MKKVIIYPSIIAFVLLLMFHVEHLNKNHENSYNSKYKKPIILVHDVSPKYFAELKEVVEIIDKYNYGNYTILFVIPDLENPPSGGKWNLLKNMNFVEYLHQLEKRGYKIELHGYKHTYHEFNCSRDECLEKLHNAEYIMKKCGFDNISLFLPPAWALNNESTEILLEHNYTIILTNMIIYPNGSSKKIINREYTWYIKENDVDKYLIKAKKDYLIASTNNIPFYISIHLGVVNYGGGLEFLDKFLNETTQIK